MQMFQLVSQLKNNPNPMSAIEQLYGNHPMLPQVKSMVRGKNPQQISETIQNACKTKGVDYNEVKTAFQNFGLYI